MDMIAVKNEQTGQVEQRPLAEVLVKIASSLNRKIGEFLQIDEFGQYWSGTVNVDASASNTVLTMDQRPFDFKIRGIGILNLNRTAGTYAALDGMTVSMTVGQYSIWIDPISTAFFAPTGGTFIRDFPKPIYAKTTDDIKFTFTNRVATNATADVLLWGTVDKKGALGVTVGR